jgi:hypothetical protein
MDNPPADELNLFGLCNELIVSPNLQPSVNRMKAAGMCSQAIMRELACGRVTDNAAPRSRYCKPVSVGPLAQEPRTSCAPILFH